MNNIRSSILLMGLMLGPLQPHAFAQLDSFQFDGRMRYYTLHLPVTYNSANSYALVVAMHGGLGSGPQLETQSLLSEKADKSSFIVVYPDGVRSPFGIRTWNAGICCGYAADNNIDDVGFILQLIENLQKDFNIDAAGIYATGMSNGGFMSYRLACEAPNVFAAIAPVAASMAVNCEPQLPVPVIHFHSYLDDNVPYQGGRGDGLSNHYNPPLDSVLGVWSTKSACKTGKDTIRDAADYDYFVWDSCRCKSEYHLYLTHDGGHSWPGGKKTAVGDPTSKAIVANDLMWDFFVAHPKCDLNRIPILRFPPYFYPNPSMGSENVNFVNYQSTNFQLLDPLGRDLHVEITEDLDGFSIKTNALRSGLYYVILENSEGMLTFKLFISH